MPLYEYQCQQCHRLTEKIQKFSDAPLSVCPFCGGPLERTLTAPAVQFKGSGWYKDLYSSAKPPAPASTNAGDISASADAKAPAADAKADTKPASTPAPAASAPAASPSTSGPSKS